jgi:hypothetical protein
MPLDARGILRDSRLVVRMTVKLWRQSGTGDTADFAPSCDPAAERCLIWLLWSGAAARPFETASRSRMRYEVVQTLTVFIAVSASLFVL